MDVIQSTAELITNKVFLSAAIAWTVAQLIKISIDIFKSKKISMRLFFESGGFPSSHSSTVTALTLAILLQDGINSLFVLSLMFSCIVIYDSLKIRYQAGLHAKALNKIKNFKLIENLGHTPVEVIGGIILGIIISLLII